MGNGGTPKRPSIWKMALHAVWDGGPGLCHFAITSACNARCGFCSFARDQLPATSRHSVTLDEAKLAADILNRNGVRFLHFLAGRAGVRLQSGPSGLRVPRPLHGCRFQLHRRRSRNLFNDHRRTRGPANL